MMKTRDGGEMEPRMDRTTTIDLTELEHALAQRACWHEDPDAYRQGVHDTVEELRRTTGRDADRRRGVVAV